MRPRLPPVPGLVEELPKLVETCKQYRQFEGNTLERVMQARAAAETARERGDVKEVGAAERQIRSGLGSLFAVAEAYPELKADANFRALQEQLAAIEDELQMARRYYNGTVRKLNNLIQSFPSNLVAGRFGFEVAEFFELEAGTPRGAPAVDFGAP